MTLIKLNGNRVSHFNILNHKNFNLKRFIFKLSISNGICSCFVKSIYVNCSSSDGILQLSRTSKIRKCGLVCKRSNIYVFSNGHSRSRKELLTNISVLLLVSAESSASRIIELYNL